MIADLSGLTREGITLSSIGIITNMLTDLQAMFPDVLRKVLIINAPFWISTIWSFISPVLSKQTQRKIEFLGADWKEKLQVSVFVDFSSNSMFRFISTKVFCLNSGEAQE